MSSVSSGNLLKQLALWAAAGAVALLAWVLNVGQLYWMAVVLLALPPICRRYARWEARGIRVSRAAPAAGDQGQVVTIRLHAENPTGIPRINLSVRDLLPEGLTALVEKPLPLHLPAHRDDTAIYQLRLARRGAHQIKQIEVESADLLGFAAARIRLPLVSSILVYPRTVELSHDLLPLDRGGGSAPIEASREKGEGSGFFGIREYRPGDPLRHVHWRTTARLDRLAVIEWEAEQSTDTLLIIDTSPDSILDLTAGTTLDLAAGLAASAGRMILDRGDTLELLAPGSPDWKSSRGATGTPAAMLEVLARMQEHPGASLTATVRSHLDRLPAGVLVACFTANPGPDLVAAVRTLLAARCYVWIYALVPDDPAFSAAWRETASGLEGLGARVAPVRRDDDVVKLLLE